MGLINTIDNNRLKELLGKCWMTHDGMWFYHTQSELGMDAANRLNKKAMESMVPFEIKRLKNLAGISDDKVRTYDGFKRFFSTISDILVPDFMNVGISFEEPNLVRWEFNDKKCFAYNGISMMGVVEDYECGPLFRIKCWLNTLGIPYEMDPDINKCIMPDKGECSGVFRLIWP